MTELIIQLVPMMLIQALMLFGVVPLARRVSRKWLALWVICALIPLVGSFTFFILCVKVLVAILDRLEAIKPSA